MTRTLSLSLMFVFGLGCSALLAATPSSNATTSLSPQPIAVAETAEQPKVAQVDPPRPWLCDLEDGKWCQGCGAGPCPQGDEGWLCCIGDICVAVQFYSDCTTGTAGWCSNYTETTSPAGNKTATCHDE